MDAAAAAAMSGPDRNPHFRRRWDESAPEISTTPARRSTGTIGTSGLALQEALLLRANGPTIAGHLSKPPEGTADG